MANLLKRLMRKLYRTAQRAINQSHCDDFPDVCPYVRKISGPVLGDGSTGTLFDPCVRKFSDSEFTMYVAARASDTIDCYSSRNGESWVFEGTSLYPRSGKWDSLVNRACVLQVGHCWYMWYTGQNLGRSAIGVAISQDGKCFKRILDAPVLEATHPFEGVSVMNPCVIWDESISCYRMWYSAGNDYEPDVLCYAESDDGLTWKKGGVAISPSQHGPDSYKVGGSEIVHVDEVGYICFYIGYQNLDVSRICCAISDDGFDHWKKLACNPILGPTKNQWDGHAVYKPAVVVNPDSSLSIWYNGRRGRNEYIGMAVCNSLLELLDK